jgi:hypothetical protein
MWNIHRVISAAQRFGRFLGVKRTRRNKIRRFSQIGVSLFHMATYEM